jgi:phosphodiesterase/alkaline phosphatase D-like protein
MKTTMILTGLLLLICAGCGQVQSDPVSELKTWTAPDPNDATGNTCAEYDLRYTTDTTLAFDQWTQVAGVPAPQPAGTPESFEVLGLLPNTAYWFVIRSADSLGWWSEWSNVVHIVTPDNEPPDQITDLM